jgi:hypothetical protein
LSHSNGSARYIIIIGVIANTIIVKIIPIITA